MPTPDQIDEQVQLERDQINQGLKKLQNNTRQLEEKSYASASIYGISSIDALLPLVVSRIEDTTNRIKEGKTGKAFKEIQRRLRLKSEEEGRLIAADALKEAERIADATRLQAMVRGALSRKHFDKARLRQIVEDERIRKAASQRLRESARDRRLREDEAAMEDRYLDDVTEGHHHRGHHHHRNSKESVAKQREDWANELKDAQREAAEVALGIRADSSSDDEVVDKKAEKDFDCLALVSLRDYLCLISQFLGCFVMSCL